MMTIDHVDHDVYGNHDDRLNHGDFGDYDQPDDHDKHDDRPDHNELMTIKFVRKLEVVHKEVGGCLISYNLQLACVMMLEVIWPDTQSVR